MARYISERHAQEAMSTVICDCIRDKKIPTYEDVSNALLTCPTADVAEVKYGEWEFIGGYGYQYRCSVCITCAEHKTKYCPNCGARMERRWT